MGPRFNGVEDKAVLAEAATATSGELTASMGPRFNGVEDAFFFHSNPHSPLASMGPRFNGVEDQVKLPRPPSDRARFNGATL